MGNRFKFFTLAYCDTLLALGDALRVKPVSLAQEQKKEELIYNCVAWLNAHALTHGAGHVAVSENSLSTMVH